MAIQNKTQARFTHIPDEPGPVRGADIVGGAAVVDISGVCNGQGSDRTVARLWRLASAEECEQVIGALQEILECMRRTLP